MVQSDMSSTHASLHYYIVFSDTQVRDAGEAALRTALPDTKIYR